MYFLICFHHIFTIFGSFALFWGDVFTFCLINYASHFGIGLQGSELLDEVGDLV